MFDSSVLNVFIGLILIFLLYSLLATALQESLSAIFQRRANTLHRGIKSMLTNTEPNLSLGYRFIGWLASMWGELHYWICSWFFNHKEMRSLYEKFYDHPIIKNYGENLIFNKPSYLTAQNFSTILIDTIKALDKDNELKTANFKMVRDTIYAFSNIPVSVKKELLNTDKNNFEISIDYETFKILNYHLNEAAGDLDVFRSRLEKWFTDTMDRVSGWYKRDTQFWLLILGLLLSITFNLDTIEITNFLSKDKVAAAKLADMGTAMANNSQYSGVNPITKEIYDSLKSDLNTVNTVVGLGWGDYGMSNEDFRNKVIENNKVWKNEKPSYRRIANSLYHRDCDKLERKIYEVKQLPKIDSNKLEKFQVKFFELQQNTLNEIEKRQLQLFYENEGATIKRKYIFYRIKNDSGKWIGFFLSAIAISLGAPFWFDLLNKFVSLRTAVKTVDSSGSTTKNNSVDKIEIDG